MCISICIHCTHIYVLGVGLIPWWTVMNSASGLCVRVSVCLHLSLDARALCWRTGMAESSLNSLETLCVDIWEQGVISFSTFRLFGVRVCVLRNGTQTLRWSLTLLLIIIIPFI